MQKEEIKIYFEAPKLFQKHILIKSGITYIIDLKELLEDNYEAYNYFLDNPEEIRKIICQSVSESTTLFRESRTERFKIINFESVEAISKLRVEHMNKLVKVQGMISKTTKVIAMTTARKFDCPNCGTIIHVIGPKEPTRCSCGRRGMFNCFSEEFADVQEIELEEMQDALGDKQPQKIRVRFMYELCDKDISSFLQPGNKIEIIGVVEKIEIFKTNKKEDEKLFEYRVNAFDLNSLEEKYNDAHISIEDEKQIREIAMNKPLEQLSNSLAPSIHGHMDIKKAIILQMAGGVKGIKSDGSLVRDRINTLLVGDPGTGKSHLAKCTKERMPKSYYVSGDSSTKAGLIAMTEKDELLNQWSVKAGALCKANDSVLVIDEADKLSDEDRAGLHTPMESGEILIDKAGIHTRLKASCSILAVANPKEGMFDLSTPEKTITRQIDLPPALLSRFDLIFVMTDEIDETNDSSIVDAIYSGTKSESTISIELFRKYISFVRKHVPKRRMELVNNIKEFYNKVRSQSISPNSQMKGMPITPRHIEGILRLSEANAKIRLSEYVEEEDLKIAQDLFYNSLIKLGMDEDGIIDFARTGNGRTVSKKQKAQNMFLLINQMTEQTGQFVPYKDIILQAESKLGMNVEEAKEYIELLRSDARLIEPKMNYIQIVK